MRQSVRDRFIAFTTPLEARVRWMYVDVKGLITTGIGNLIDPVDAALALPWQHDKTGAPATRDEITAAWSDLKNDRERLGRAGHRPCEHRNDLRLTDSAIDTLVLAKLDANAVTFTRGFPGFDSWPADAQLAAMSLCWAMGAAFAPSHKAVPAGQQPPWSALTAALNAQDFAAAATHCSMSEVGNPGLAPRNVADIALFRTAAAVVAAGADPAVLYYPGSPPAAGTPAAGTTPTGTTDADASPSTTDQNDTTTGTEATTNETTTEPETTGPGDADTTGESTKDTEASTETAEPTDTNETTDETGENTTEPESTTDDTESGTGETTEGTVATDPPDRTEPGSTDESEFVDPEADSVDTGEAETTTDSDTTTSDDTEPDSTGSGDTTASGETPDDGTAGESANTDNQADAGDPVPAG